MAVQPLPAQAASDTGLETVTVTATKRAEKLQDVPMGVGALTGDTLQKLNAANFEDFISRLPAVTLVATDAGHSQIVMRGINTGGIGATVGTYIDETPYGSSNSLANGLITTPNIDTFDISRVEVLRGPQGTLYGANTLGGLLKFVTNAPDPSQFDDKLELGVDDVAHGGVGWSAKGMLNLPITDDLAVRVVAYHDKQSGYIDDPVRGAKDVNGASGTGGRVSVLWKPTDDLSIRLTAHAQNFDFDGNNSIDGTFVPSGPGYAISLTPLFGPYEQGRTVAETSKVHYRVYNGTIDYDLGFGTLTSASSYGTFSDHSIQDATGLLGLLIRPDLEQKKFTQEIRLASPSDATLEWLAGFFYTNEKSSLLQNLVVTPDGDPIAFLQVDSGYAELAGFADVTYHFTPAFDVSLGGRWAQNSQHALQFGLADASGGSSEGVLTWSVAPRWHVDENTMVYARIAKGYQPGGPNVLPPNPGPGVPASFKSDTLINYELGVKSSLDDNRISFDVDAFYITWNNIQLLTEVGGFGINGNGGTADSKGFEWDVSWNPIDPLTLRLGGAYVDARLTADAGPLLGAQSGDPLPFVPQWSGSLDGDYRFASVGGFTPFVGASWRYLGPRFSAFDANFGQTKLPGYNEFDLRAGVDWQNWTLTLYAKNVTDQRGITSVGPGGSAASIADPVNLPVPAPAISIDRPRVIGLTITGKI
jgi:outer membrane receptor protein involved in Fe transport